MAGTERPRDRPARRRPLRRRSVRRPTRGCASTRPSTGTRSNELWGISRYDDIVEIEKAKDVFINSDKEKGGYRPNLPAGPVDHRPRRPAAHASGASWSTVASRRGRCCAWEDHVEATVTGLLDAAAAQGRGSSSSSDLAGAAAREDDRPAPRLPARDVAEAHGVVGAHHRRRWWPALRRRRRDDARRSSSPARARSSTRRSSACPADDIMTVWTTAEIDGEPLGLDPVISDCLLLLDGGAETTRTVIARTILELADRPDQYAAAPRRRRHDGRDRGVHPLGHARAQHVPRRQPRLRAPRHDHPPGSAGRAHVPVGQPRPGALRRPRALRRHPHAQPPHRVRLRHPLLPRRRARPARDPHVLRGVRAPGARRSGSCPVRSTTSPNAFVNGVNRAEVELELDPA